MRLMLQRALSAAVYFEGKLQSSCNKGYLIFLCAMKGDTENDLNTLLKKNFNPTECIWRKYASQISE